MTVADLGFRERCYIVTGGSRGIGRATCDLLLAAGAAVVTCARAWPAGRTAEREHRLVLDVRRAADVEALCAAAIATFGRIDGAVSNAGVACVGTVLDTADADLEDHIALRLLSAWRLVRHAAPHMAQAGGGAFVFLAGAAGVDPTPMLAAPGVVNAALQNLSRTVADEFAEARIRCNVVNPGTLDTRLGRDVIEAYAGRLGLDADLIRDEAFGALPLGRLPTAVDVANAVGFLLSDQAAMITGSALTPDGGILVRRARG